MNKLLGTFALGIRISEGEENGTHGKYLSCSTTAKEKN